jgi:cytochrome c5
MGFFFKSPMDSNNSSMKTTELTKKIRPFPNKLIQLVALVIAAISLAVMFVTSLATAQTPAAASKPKQETKTTTTATAKAEPLSGAELWTMNCSRCHITRTPGEFTAAQWQTIMRHMRIRANLPAAQAREIQKYFEASAGK